MFKKKIRDNTCYEPELLEIIQQVSNRKREEFENEVSKLHDNFLKKIKQTASKTKNLAQDQHSEAFNSMKKKNLFHGLNSESLFELYKQGKLLLFKDGLKTFASRTNQQKIQETEKLLQDDISQSIISERDKIRLTKKNSKYRGGASSHSVHSSTASLNLAASHLLSSCHRVENNSLRELENSEKSLGNSNRLKAIEEKMLTTESPKVYVKAVSNQSRSPKKPLGLSIQVSHPSRKSQNLRDSKYIEKIINTSDAQSSKFRIRSNRGLKLDQSQNSLNSLDQSPPLSKSRLPSSKFKKPLPNSTRLLETTTKDKNSSEPRIRQTLSPPPVLFPSSNPTAAPVLSSNPSRPSHQSSKPLLSVRTVNLHPAKITSSKSSKSIKLTLSAQARGQQSTRNRSTSNKSSLPTVPFRPGFELSRSMLPQQLDKIRISELFPKIRKLVNDSQQESLLSGQ